ncbi:CPBP family intramembrane glutamic endopeptidase [Streptococcus caprae]|uniref:CPBP family intramembrane glutamic endopeptidase n=1 Tax=Streptococcus caprae TaxID=1640501 RepID=A0ABV8CX80_9STRE
MKKQGKILQSPFLKAVLMTLIFVGIEILAMGFGTIHPLLYDLALNGCCLALAWFMTCKVDKKPWKRMGLSVSKKSGKGFLIALLLTASAVVIGTVLSRFIFHDEVFVLRGTVTVGGILVTVVAFLQPAFISQGFPEELIFRGYLVPMLKDKYNGAQTMAISVGLFTLIHAIHLREGWAYGLLTMFYAFSFACLAYMMKELCQTTWAAVAVHGGVHFTRMLLMLFGFAETDTAVLVQSIVLSLLVVVIGVYFRKRLFFCILRSS